MNILYICHRLPYPPSRGGKIRPFNMIRHLGRQHSVTVASLARSVEEAEAGRGLADHCEEVLSDTISPPAALARMLTRLPTSIPSSMGHFYSPRLARAITAVLDRRSFDLILVHCSSVAQYVEDVTGIPKILDFGDMDSRKWLQYARFRPFPLSLGYLIEGRKLERAERRLAASFDLCTCTTRAELATLESYGVTTSTGWFPNGVDHEYFRPAGEGYEPDSLCFIGRMDYYPNQQCMLKFCAEILPLVRERRPNVTLTIIGADPSAEIRRLGSLQGVSVTGSVPDVRPYVQRSAVSVAPLEIARGTQNKILEALAMGVPVVASTAAAGGIDAVPGEHCLVADSPREHADAIIAVLEDPSIHARLARAGRQRMLSYHDWTNSMRRLDVLIDRCLEIAPGRDMGTAPAPVTSAHRG